MFSPTSRYYGLAIHRYAVADGREVNVVSFPRRESPALLGFHRRQEGQRLDLIAAHYLKEPTAFWQLCDANDAPSPHALEARALIGIPRKER